MLTDNINKFCSMIESRSAENKAVFEFANSSNYYRTCMSLLRQEIDSLIRLYYLINVEEPEEKKRLIDLNFEGERWYRFNSNKKELVTDFRMHRLLNNRDKVYDWVSDLYTFGCSFIHLSN